jgi:hypothetical protein
MITPCYHGLLLESVNLALINLNATIPILSKSYLYLYSRYVNTDG